MKSTGFLIALCMVVVGVFGLPTMGLAATPPEDARENSIRIQNLTSQLRCLTCLNETVASSQTVFGGQVRSQVTSMVQSGLSDAQILDTLKNQYGQDILMTPPLKDAPVLWILPWVLVLVATGGLVIALWQKAKVISSPPTPPPTSKDKNL